MAIDQPNLIGSVAAALLALSWLFVMLRVYVRYWVVKAFGADDWLAVASLIVFTLHCIFVFVGLKYLTRSNSETFVSDSIEALKWWYAASLPYIAGTALIKATVGVFLLRFCSTRAQVYTIYVVLAIVTAYDIAYLTVCVFQCLPVGHFWLQFTGQKGTCISRKILTQLSYTASVLNAVGDIILGTLPIFLVRNLQMSYRTKVSVASILALGSISCISTVVRIPYLVTLLTTIDFLTATTPIAIIGIVELGLGLIAASMVTLKPLFKSWFSGEGSLYARSKGSRNTVTPPFPGRHSRSRSDFIELEGQKLSGRGEGTESEEALAVADTLVTDREAKYGNVGRSHGGVFTMSMNYGGRR